jgi:putative ABC transport system permease protein
MGTQVPVARRNILAERRRLAIAVLGVGLAVALILLLEGLWSGLLTQISAYPDRVGATFFVRQPGARTLSEGVVPVAAAGRVRAVPGVAAAGPVLTRWVVLSLHGQKQVVTVVGFTPGSLGGPWAMAAGRTVRADGEVVMDQTLAAEHGITLGGTLRVTGRAFRVVGLSSGTRSFMGTGYLFMSLHSAQVMLGEAQAATFILVRAADPGAVQAAIAGRTGLSVASPALVAAAEQTLYAGIMGKIFNLMVVIAFAAGTLIVALTVYSAVADRLGEYGIAKALGARRGRLFRIVAGQTTVLSGLGLVAGLLLYLGGSRLIAALWPQFQAELTLRALGVVTAAALFMGMLAAVVPTHRVARLDPASVYRR